MSEKSNWPTSPSVSSPSCRTCPMSWSSVSPASPNARTAPSAGRSGTTSPASRSWPRRPRSHDVQNAAVRAPSAGASGPAEPGLLAERPNRRAAGTGRPQRSRAPHAKPKRCAPPTDPSEPTHIARHEQAEYADNAIRGWMARAWQLGHCARTAAAARLPRSSVASTPSRGGPYKTKHLGRVFGNTYTGRAYFDDFRFRERFWKPQLGRAGVRPGPWAGPPHLRLVAHHRRRPPRVEHSPDGPHHRADAPRTLRRLDRIRRRRPALSRRAQARPLAALYSHPKIFPQSAKTDIAAT